MLRSERLEPWLLKSLGGRVALTSRWGEFPPGRTGVLISIQAAVPPLSRVPYVTVGFNLADPTDEESVPLHLIRPVECRR
jgi:hypothetical protein